MGVRDRDVPAIPSDVHRGFSRDARADRGKRGDAPRAAAFRRADPAPPIKGDNTWVLDFTDLGGQPMAGLTMTAVPMMPDHGHGTPVEAIVTPLETPGQYEITPVNLFMTGYWEVNMELTLSGGEQDALMFGFCVE